MSRSAVSVFGQLLHEPFWVCGVSSVEHAGALLADDRGGAVVHVGRNVQTQSGMAMFVVVPAKEDQAVPAGSLDRVEPVGKSGRYFNVLNCASLLSGIPDNSDYAEGVV